MEIVKVILIEEDQLVELYKKNTHIHSLEQINYIDKTTRLITNIDDNLTQQNKNKNKQLK